MASLFTILLSPLRFVLTLTRSGSRYFSLMPSFFATPCVAIFKIFHHQSFHCLQSGLKQKFRMKTHLQYSLLPWWTFGSHTTDVQTGTEQSLRWGVVPARRSVLPRRAETTSHTELISKLQKRGKFLPPVISALAPCYIHLILFLFKITEVECP